MSKRIYPRKISSSIKNHDLIEKRRNQIFQGARKLFTKKGYHLTGLRELSKETGIGLGNLYNYIKTKGDILYIIHQETAEIISRVIDQETSHAGDPMAKLKEMIEIELHTIDKYQDLILLIYQESHALSKKSLHSLLRGEEMHLQRYQKILEAGMALGVFRSCNSTMLANIIKIMIDCWALKRWSLRQRVSLEEMKKGILELVEKGIVNRTMKPTR
jgi:AcrR family transcriptional regulator